MQLLKRRLKLKSPSLMLLLVTQVLADLIGAGLAWAYHKNLSDGSQFGLMCWCMIFGLYAIAMQFD